jgi:hypothetical protein
VVVDDGADVSIIDGGRQFSRIVGVDDDNRRAGLDVGNDRWLGQVPACQQPCGFGVGLAQQFGLGRGALDFGQIPRPDDGLETSFYLKCLLQA